MISTRYTRRQKILPVTLSLTAVLMTAQADSIPERPPYEILPVGAVKPQGWLLEQLRADLQEGISGNYDKFHSDVAGELFAKQNRVPGTKLTGSRGMNEKAWWAGEIEGNWHDGLVRSAILVDSESDLARIRTWVENILTRYNETGYIGIYSPESRFPARGFDGELWTQSRAMEALLAWYETTGDRRVLDAVSATVRKTISHYRGRGSYFQRPGADGGVAHGVGYMDTLEWLWRLTGDRFFADAAVWLYQDYNGFKGMDDLRTDHLLDIDKLWTDHTPHTSESMHMPGIAGFFSGNEKFLKASGNVLPKLLRHTNPGGGFIAGKLEAIGEVIGGGDEANEYCAKTQGVITLGRLFQYQPDLALGDWAERCALNAGQGARFHTANTGAIYLSRDNRLRADTPRLQGGREIYSAAHLCAACCTLNAVRLLPAYVAGMWYRSNKEPGFVASLYGASELKTDLNGTSVRIVQETDYPFSGKVRFRIETGKPVAFALTLRIPPNSGKVDVQCDGAEISREEKAIRLSKVWKAGDTLDVDFDFQVHRAVQQDGRQAFYEWGPLVFALPIKAEVTEWKPIERNGEKTAFHDFFVRPADPAPWATMDHPAAAFKRVDLDGDRLDPWARPPVGLKGLLKKMDGTPFEASLVPLGSTILRRTTFPLTKEDAVEANKKHKGASFGDADDPMRDF